MKKLLIPLSITLVLFFWVIPLFSVNNDKSEPIVINGKFEEWTPSHLIHMDPLNDNNNGNIDLGKLWIAHTSDFLFLSIEVGDEINLQAENDLVFLINTDNDNATGIPGNGFGAELFYAFGSRYGKMVDEKGQSYRIGHAHIGLVAAPTVSSRRFELALNRKKVPNLFRSDTLQISFMNNIYGGDCLPDTGSEPITYVLEQKEDDPPIQFSLDRHPDTGIRVVSYNMLRTGLFDPERANIFARIFKALKPDIIGMQEMYESSASAVLTKLMDLDALDNDYNWYSQKQGPDNIVISRFPIKHAKEIEGGNGAFLVDLTSECNSDLLIINAHPPCCDNNKDRQYEIDAIMAYIRDLKMANGAFPLPKNTPIIILGDLNLVGYAQQLETLLNGDIMNKAFGSDFSPDWDGSGFTDLTPPIPALPFTFTWYSETSSFSPGRLDFMIFSDSVLEPLRSFVLFTPSLSGDRFTAYGLKSSDVTKASDHLPVVCDFKILKK